MIVDMVEAPMGECSATKSLSRQLYVPFCRRLFSTVSICAWPTNEKTCVCMCDLRESARTFARSVSRGPGFLRFFLHALPSPELYPFADVLSWRGTDEVRLLEVDSSELLCAAGMSTTAAGSAITALPGNRPAGRCGELERKRPQCNHGFGGPQL